MIVQPLVLCGAARAVCPALTLAAVHVVTDDDPVLLAMASEHSVARPDAWLRALERGAALAHSGYLACFGSAAGVPDPGLGMVRVGGPLAGGGDACYLDAVLERPEPSLGLLWNSGIFMVRASVWIEAVGSVRPDFLGACERAYRRGGRAAGIWGLSRTTSFAMLETLAALRSRGEGPEAVVVRLEAGGAGVRAWDLVNPCKSFLLAEHQLVSRVGDEDAVLVEIPSYDDARAAA